MLEKRLEYIDIARGIGILLVVLGHSDARAISPLLFQWIYSFHMPLFFFLSGMFFKPDLAFGALLRRRWESLVKPYLFVIALVFFFTVFFTGTGLNMALSRAVKALYGTGYYLDWTVWWFLPALFFSTLLAWGFYRLFGGLKLWWRWLISLLLLPAGAWMIARFAPWQLSILGRDLTLMGLPWNLDLVLLTGFFFIVGFETGKTLTVRFFSNLATLLLALIINLGLNFYFPVTLDLTERVYAPPVVATLTALSGIFFTLALSAQLERAPRWLSGSLSYLGRISMIILLFHIPVVTFTSEKLSALVGQGWYISVGAWLMGVLVPVVLYEVGIKQNARLAGLFGLKSA
jgi:fucose 4-O-acetylase-like acetyltransferase